MKNERLYLNLQEVSDRYPVNPRLLRAWIGAGKVTAVRIGRFYMVSAREIERVLRDNEHKPRHVRRLISVVLLGLCIASPCIADETRDLTVYDRDYNVQERVKDGNVYDRDYQRKGYLKDNKVYDENYQRKDNLKNNRETGK